MKFMLKYCSLVSNIQLLAQYGYVYRHFDCYYH